ETLGLSPCDVKPRIFDGQAAAAFTAKIAPGLVALGVDPQDYAQRAAPLQYVWRARKRLQQRLSIASSMLEPVGGVSHMRIAYPLQALRTDAMITTQFSSKGESEITNVASDTPRIFTLHRPSLLGEAGASRIRRLLSEGWVIVTEFDDHPDHFGMLGSDDQYAFSGVHAVQTSTLALASVLRRYNPEVAVFSNMIPSLPDVHNFTDPNVVTLFFGALNREQDWAPLMLALNAAAEKAGERLRFCVVHDQGFFDSLHTPHKQFTPTCDHDTYMALLGQCEISFMPLADTPFNRAKSDLKFIEAGACRVAALASHIVYADSVEDGRTGLLFRDADQLRDRLLRLVAMPGLAQGLGSAARNYVAGERMLAYQVVPRIAWYRSLWARREELTNALYSRLANVPQQGFTAPLRRPTEFGALS
ncbi:MAG TPA: glycosyltransferase, partial [Rhodanobacter sp.]